VIRKNGQSSDDMTASPLPAPGTSREGRAQRYIRPITSWPGRTSVPCQAKIWIAYRLTELTSCSAKTSLSATEGTLERSATRMAWSQLRCWTSLRDHSDGSAGTLLGDSAQAPAFSWVENRV